MEEDIVVHFDIHWAWGGNERRGGIQIPGSGRDAGKVHPFISRADFPQGVKLIDQAEATFADKGQIVIVGRFIQRSNRRSGQHGVLFCEIEHDSAPSL